MLSELEVEAAHGSFMMRKDENDEDIQPSIVYELSNTDDRTNQYVTIFGGNNEGFDGQVIFDLKFSVVTSSFMARESSPMSFQVFKNTDGDQLIQEI